MQIMQGEQGVVAHVKLPPREELDQYNTLELDFTLGCPGVCLIPVSLKPVLSRLDLAQELL